MTPTKDKQDYNKQDHNKITTSSHHRNIISFAFSPGQQSFSRTPKCTVAPLKRSTLCALADNLWVPLPQNWFEMRHKDRILHLTTFILALQSMGHLRLVQTNHRKSFATLRDFNPLELLTDKILVSCLCSCIYGINWCRNSSMSPVCH